MPAKGKKNKATVAAMAKNRNRVWMRCIIIELIIGANIKTINKAMVCEKLVIFAEMLASEFTPDELRIYVPTLK